MLDKFHGKWRAGLLLSGLLVVLTVAGAFVFHLGTTPKASASTALWPSTASPGSTILVTGLGFPTQDRVQVYFQTPDRETTALANASGTFSVPLTIPSAYIPGTPYYVYVNSDTYSTKMLFNFAKLGVFPTDPSTQLTFGSPTSFTGRGFKPNEEVKLAWSDAMGSTVDAGSLVAGSDGSFTTTLTPPSIPRGAQGKLIATGVASGFSTSTAITDAAGIIFDPASGPAGTVINVKGGSFGRDEMVNVSFEGAIVATVKTDNQGAFTTSFTTAEADEIGYYDNAIQALGRLSRASAKGGFDIEPKITIHPNHGGAGTKVTVSGKHFSRNGDVKIYLVSDKEHESRVDRCLLAKLNATAKGTFSIVVTIPSGDCLEDLSHIVALDQKTGDKGVATFFGEDNDEGHED